MDLDAQGGTTGKISLSTEKNIPVDQVLMRRIAQLEATLKLYTMCRHGSLDCFCTKEAKYALLESENANLKRRIKDLKAKSHRQSVRD